MTENTDTRATAQELFDEPWLPEVADIVPGSDVFDRVTPTEPFWRDPQRSTLDENMSMNAILLKWEMGSVGAYEAFQAMEANGLVCWDTLLFMISVQHRTRKIIDGDE